MKWTLYAGPKGEPRGRFNSKREALRAMEHSTETVPFWFLIGRAFQDDPLGDARHLRIYSPECRLLAERKEWTLGHEADIAMELLDD